METGISNLEVRKNGTIYYNGKLKKPYNHSKGYDIVWLEGKNKAVWDICNGKRYKDYIRKEEVNYLFL